MKKVNFQILRVAACIGVFCGHLGLQLELKGVFGKLADAAVMGVYLFFVISGYLCFASFDKKKVKVLPYYVGRLARILPVYYTVILIQFVLHTFWWRDVPYDETNLGWIRYLFCISATVPAENSFWMNLNATWSIGAFLLFYLVAPFLYRFIKNGKTALIGWLISYFAPFYLSMILGDYFRLANYLQFFLFGIAIYYIKKEKSVNKFVVLYIANLFFSVVLKSNQDINAWVMIFGLLIIGSDNWVIRNQRLLCGLNILDEYSYAIYLVHATILEIVTYWESAYEEFFKILKQPLTSIFIVGAVCAGTILGVFLIHNLIEKPVNTYVSKHI